jgi:hypothetical protein
MLHLTASPEEEINLGTARFPVSPGARYRLTVTAAVPEDSALAGYATVVFLRDDEFTRHNLALAPAATPLAEVATGPDGGFELAHELPPGSHRLRTRYPGDLDHWPAHTELILPGE